MTDTLALTAGQIQGVAINQEYKAGVDLLVVATLFYNGNGGFRGAIQGEIKVDANNWARRGAACAGWSDASGMSTNTFTMVVLKNETFRIRVADDMVPNFGSVWGAEAYAYQVA